MNKLSWEKWEKIHQELWIFIRDNIEKTLLDWTEHGSVFIAVLQLKRYFFNTLYPQFEIESPYCPACEIEESICASLKELFQLEGFNSMGCIFCPLFYNLTKDIKGEEECVDDTHVYTQLINTDGKKIMLIKSLCQQIIEIPWNKQIKEIYEMIVLDKQPDKKEEFKTQLLDEIKRVKGLRWKEQRGV